MGGGGGASRTGDKREREVSQEGPLSEGESIKQIITDYLSDVTIVLTILSQGKLTSLHNNALGIVYVCAVSSVLLTLAAEAHSKEQKQ